MRVLLLFPMADGQTGPGIKYSFEKLGHEVIAVDAKLHPGMSYVAAHEFKPDLVFCSRTEALTTHVVRIKQEFKDAITCMWNVDTRTNICHWRHLFPLVEACDYYFVVAPKLIPEWRKLNPNTFWLPEGFLPAYSKPKEITDEDREKYTCVVCRIGGRTGSHKWRDKYLDAVVQMSIKFKQWGCAGHPAIYDEMHNKAVSLSKINLAMSGWPENRNISSRDYKILAAGGFLLEKYREGLDDFFPSNTFDCYTNPDDLVEKIKYWLAQEHEWERWQIAERGYRWVMENASFPQRIRMALEYMK